MTALGDSLRTTVEISVLLLLEIAAVFLLGLIFIPLLRSKKTGRLEWKLGARFKTDGSEPSMGGLVAALAFAAAFFPLAFRTSLSASKNFQDTNSGLIASGLFAAAVMLVGLAEDRLKQFLGRYAGVRTVFKQLLIYAMCFSLLVFIAMTSRKSTEVLLPFRLGFMDFGILYYPLTALAMTVSINVFKLHFCFGGDFGSSVGGLAEADGAVSLLAVCLCSQSCSLKSAGIISLCGAACCIGMLIWTFPPSKLISGESGALFIGALFSASVTASKLELLLLLAALPQTADVAAAALHYVGFRHRRRNNKIKENEISKQPLRLYLRKRGASDRVIIISFMILGMIGAVLSAIFAVYSGSFKLIG